MCPKNAELYLALTIFGLLLESKKFVSSDTSLQEEIVTRANTFIKSMETFDVGKNLKPSCKALAASVGALVKTTGTTVMHEYSAPLFTFVKLRRESFPDVQYHVHCGGTGEEAKDTVDLLVQRADGVFFAFKAYLSWGHEMALSQLACITERNGSALFYHQFSRPVTHTVIVGIEFLGGDAMKFSYLVDTEESKNPLTVQV